MQSRAYLHSVGDLVQRKVGNRTYTRRLIRAASLGCTVHQHRKALPCPLSALVLAVEITRAERFRYRFIPVDGIDIAHILSRGADNPVAAECSTQLRHRVGIENVGVRVKIRQTV